MSLLKESGFCFLQLCNPRDGSWEYAWPPTRQSFQNGQGNRTFYKRSHCLKINLSKAHVFVYICPFWGADSSSGWCKVTTTECQGTNWLSVEWRLPSSSSLFNRVTNVTCISLEPQSPFTPKKKSGETLSSQGWLAGNSVPAPAVTESIQAHSSSAKKLISLTQGLQWEAGKVPFCYPWMIFFLFLLKKVIFESPVDLISSCFILPPSFSHPLPTFLDPSFTLLPLPEFESVVPCVQSS